MREFSIDMIPGGTQTAVACNQFEAGDTWIFALYYDGGRYSIPADAEVSITGTKPDGAAYNIAGTVVDNAVVIEVTEQMTACAGRSIAEILVESETDGTTLYSANFPLLVEPAAVQGDLSPSEIPSAIVDTDGNVYYSAEYIPEVTGGVPSSVRTAMLTLFQKAAYTEEGLADEVAVVQAWASEVTAITLSASAISINGATTSQLSAVTTPTGGAVTWESSNTAVATVSNTGLVTGVGNGTAVITARSGDVSATCTATVSGNGTLVSIAAVYTQSGTVYDTDSLDDLKDDLVVTGTYDDTSTATITGYTLSGTLTAGTSTITVSYGGKTTTFNVTVTSLPVVPYYQVNSTKYYYLAQSDDDGYLGLGYRTSRSCFVLRSGDHKLRARSDSSASFLTCDESDYYPFHIPSGAQTATVVCNNTGGSAGCLLMICHWENGMYVRSNPTVDYDSNATTHVLDVSSYNDGAHYCIPCFNKSAIPEVNASVTFS